MADVPVDVKSFAGKYIARATQMDALAAKKPETGAATVAFYCRRKALAAIMDNRDEAHLDKAEVAKFVGDLMTETERAKAALGISPATQEADKAKIRGFAVNLFGTAETDVRSGHVAAMTVRRYLNSATLLEVLEVLGPLDAETADIRKYAKYMVTEVTAALREGRAPVPPATGPSSSSGAGAYGASSVASEAAPHSATPFAGVAPPPSIPEHPSAPEYPPAGMGMPPAPGLPTAGEYNGAPGYMMPPAGMARAFAGTGMPPAAIGMPPAGLGMHVGYAGTGAQIGYNPAAAAAAAAASVAVSPAPTYSSVDLTEYVPISGACWSREVVLATKECSTAVTLLRSDDVYGAKQHLELALKQLDTKLAAHEKAGGSAKRR